MAGMSMSPGLAAMNDQAAAAVPFTQAAGLLEELAGVRLTVKRVERAAEAHGAAASAAVTARAKAIAARQVRPLPPDPQPDMLYIVIDGTGVPATGKETAERDGKGEDGRAQIREAKLAVFFPKTSWTTRATPSDAITTLRCQQASRPQDRIWQAPRNQIGAA